MKIHAVVQARMSSTRLPGKALRHLQGRPMLQYVIERLTHGELIARTVVCTSDRPEDDAIATFCREQGVACVRGPLENVAARFERALCTHPCAAFVRVCGDSPFIDQTLIDGAIEILARRGLDIVTNNLVRSFPSGQTIEVLRSDTFLDALPRMTEPEHLEHVTRFFYEHAAAYRVHNLFAEERFDEMHLSIDTPTDLYKADAILAAMDRPHWTYRVGEVVELALREFGPACVEV